MKGKGTQPYVYTCPFPRKLPSHRDCRAALSRVPCAVCWSLLVFRVKYSSVYMARWRSGKESACQCKRVLINAVVMARGTSRITWISGYFRRERSMVAAAGGVRHLATGEHAGGVTSGAPDLGSGEMPEGAPKSMYWLQKHPALSYRLVSCSRWSFCSGKFSDHSHVAQHPLAPGSLTCHVLPSHPFLRVSSAVWLQSAHSGDPFDLPRLWGPALLFRPSRFRGLLPRHLD